MRPRLVLAALIAVLAGAAAWVAPGAHASAYTPASYGSRLVALINDARAQHGLGALSVTSGTSQVAQQWSEHLASVQALSHNPNLQHDLETHGSPEWTAYGENVGAAPTDNPDALFQAYMNSSEHRANILAGAYRFIGVGVVFNGREAWNTLDFVDEYQTPVTTHRTTSTPASTVTKTPRVRHVAPAPALRRTAAPAPVVRRPARRAKTRPAPPVEVKGLHNRVSLPQMLLRADAFAGLPRATPTLGVPLPVPSSRRGASEVAVVVAAGMVGFVAMRWVNAVR